MIVQAIDPSIGIDPLLAKGVLWWFGHPVVYLLLFPAVAVLYHLVPRYAGRPLVAGRLIVARLADRRRRNVIIGAHHMYLDFPSGSAQPRHQHDDAAADVRDRDALGALALQPVRHDLGHQAEWTIPMQFLFVAMCSWLVAGPAGSDQRDDRARPRGPQHALDRRPLPQHGPAQHRARDLRGHVRVRARPDRPAVVLRAARALAPRAHDRRRLRVGHPLADPGPRRRSPALGGAARPLRDADRHRPAVRGTARRRSGALRLQPAAHARQALLRRARYRQPLARPRGLRCPPRRAGAGVRDLGRVRGALRRSGRSRSSWPSAATGSVRAGQVCSAS